MDADGMSVRYFALATDDETLDDPGGLMRELSAEGLLMTQYYDLDSNWVDRPELLRYVNGGEDGAYPISAEQAERIVLRWQSR